MRFAKTMYKGIYGYLGDVADSVTSAGIMMTDTGQLPIGPLPSPQTSFYAPGFGTVVLPPDYAQSQADLVAAAWARGGLSNAGLMTIANGQVPAGQVAQFLAQDPGQPETPAGATGATSAIQVATNLLPGPSPRVSATPTAPAPPSFLASVTRSTIIAGVPDLAIYAFALVIPLMFAGGGRRR